MSSPYYGHVEQGVVVLDDCTLPEGTRVFVQPLQAADRENGGRPRRLWKGIYRNFGPVPSDADIEELRREVWPQ